MASESSLLPSHFDPVSLLENLDIAALRARVETIDRERKALVILIRSASRRATLNAPRKRRKGVRS